MAASPLNEAFACVILSACNSYGVRDRGSNNRIRLLLVTEYFLNLLEMFFFPKQRGFFLGENRKQASSFDKLCWNENTRILIK